MSAKTGLFSMLRRLSGMTDMRVRIAGVEFKNPIAVASGTFGFGHEYGSFYSLNELGAICVKGLTLRPREGNPPPRIAETPSGMLNSVGLQNPGVDAFIRDELPFLRKFDTKIIANISGNTVDEYREMAEKISAAGADLIELNISCPNVKAGGMAFGTSASMAAEVTLAAKKCSSVPLMVKLSPNVTDIAEIARAVADAGADALSMINTLLGMRIDINSRRPILRNNTGGLSGPAVLPVAIRMIWQAASAVSLPILGMGGVSTASDAVEMMLAGASAVAVGTASFGDPYAPVKVRDGLRDYLEKRGIERASDLTRGILPY
jgi:dihydroorotate dehydrogenase (NAD+) catalytic subunit